MNPRRWALASLLLVALAACTSDTAPRLTLSGSALGPEADLLRTQLQRFAASHPDLDVVVTVTPDAADQRHQLYVQWLNARSPEPDVLQLDVIWTQEFAAAGWIAAFDDVDDAADFIPAALAAGGWRGRLYAVPWFVDVGLLYRRTDLVRAPPASLAELQSAARAAREDGTARFGMVWQGARYEGLITVFVEYLAAFGGSILDDRGAVSVDRPEAVQALTFMRDALAPGAYVPPSVLAWQEEQVRFAFQNGDALFMRNWPYAYPLLQDAEESRVRGKVAVSALPPAPGGRQAAALGGSLLAINARSRHPAAAADLVRFLTAPEQMLERARAVGQIPARRSLYSNAALADSLAIPGDTLRGIVDAAVARPMTPVYSELSEILQVRLHRALSGQQSPNDALRDAGREIRALLSRSGLAEGAGR
jgi:multiple sugar transport system substrate-binding protein